MRRLAIAAPLLLLLALLGAGVAQGVGVDFDRLKRALSGQFGNYALNRFNEWQQTLNTAQNLAESDKLRQINDFYNRRIAFDDDYSVWGISDYWATPMEFIDNGRGDCEDFAISKYYSLLSLGVPVNKLRMVYVRAQQSVPGGTVQQAHMVLAYYARPDADPLILDNLNPQILPASRRHDLSPVFSFNSAGLWQGTGNQTSGSSLSRWQDLLARARAEGFQ